MSSRVLIALAALVSACCLCRARADCSSSVSGVNLRILKAGLLGAGASTRNGCYGLFTAALSPNSTETGSLDAMYGFVLRLGMSASSNASNCSAGTSDAGRAVLAELLACNCTGLALACKTSCLQDNSASILSLAAQVGAPSSSCSASLAAVAALVHARLPAAVGFMAYLVRLLASVDGVNAVTAQLTQLSTFRDSTVSGVSTSSLASGEALVLVCAAMFPCEPESESGNASRRALPVCGPVCDRLRPAVDVFALFANVSTIPIAAVLDEALAAACPTATNTSGGGERPCFGLVGSLIGVTNASSSGATPGQFCLDLSCPAPLRRTPNSAHWNPQLQAAVFGIHGLVRRVFPASSTPFDGSILPCGQDCVAVGISDSSVRVARIFLSTFSTLAVVVVVLSTIVFFFNRKRLVKRPVRRVLLLFCCSAAVASTGYVASAYPGQHSLLCHPDGTLRLREPDGGNPRCALGATVAYLFVSIAAGYFVAMAHSWYRLINALNLPQRRVTTSMDVFHRTYRLDLVYAACAITPPLILSIVALGVRGLEGNVTNGVCSLSVTRNYYISFYIGYFCLMMLLGTLFLFAGIRRLTTQRKGMAGMVQWLKHRGRTATLASLRSRRKARPPAPDSPATAGGKDKHSEARFSGMARHEKRLKKEMNHLAFQILYYCFVAIVNLLCTVSLGVYIGVQNSTWKEETQAHVLCVVTSCRPERCTALPSPQIAVIILPIVVQFASLALIAAWPFSRDFLVNVPLVRRLYLRNAGTDAGASSGYESADTPSSSHALHAVDAPHSNGGGAAAMQALSPLSAAALPVHRIHLAAPGDVGHSASDVSHASSDDGMLANGHGDSSMARLAGTTPRGFAESDV